MRPWQPRPQVCKFRVLRRVTPLQHRRITLPANLPSIRNLTRRSTLPFLKHQNHDLEFPAIPNYSRNAYDEATIYALSTAPGRAAIAIVRISGSLCLDIYEALTASEHPPRPRYATLKQLHDPELPDNIIESGALILYFPAPKTVTGEDVLELHIHGGNAIVKAVLQAIQRVVKKSSSSPIIRYAEPGEFTRRAFWNGRLDLTQVEALGDTLAAETEQQRQLAVKGSCAIVAQKYDEWRQLLLNARGELEALIDFEEDNDLGERIKPMFESIRAQVEQLQNYLKASIDNAFRGELLRNGFSIALLGAPNVGKSSLLNRIVQRDAAIVSSQAGTTRDIIDVGVDIEGFFCRFGDLAGLRSARSKGNTDEATTMLDPVEQEGMRRATQRAVDADLVLVVLDFAQTERGPALRPLNRRLIEAITDAAAAKRDMLYVINKSDVLSPQELKDFDMRCEVSALLDPEDLLPTLQGDPVLVSCLPQHTEHPTGEAIGLPKLLRQLSAIFKQKSDAITLTTDAVPESFWEQSLGASERHRLLLQECLTHLDSFVHCGYVPWRDDRLCNTTGEDESIDVVSAAEHLRDAAKCLAKITGKGDVGGDVEEVLGVVFEKFCVGK